MQCFPFIFPTAQENCLVIICAYIRTNDRSEEKKTRIITNNEERVVDIIGGPRLRVERFESNEKSR